MKPAFTAYKPPAIDSAKALANAKTFLCSAVSLKNTTADGLARQYRLSPKRAEYELTIAKQKRANRGE